MKIFELLWEIYKEEYELNLKESLTKTTPVGESISILKKQFPKSFFQYDKGDSKFSITIKNIEEIGTSGFEKLLALLTNLGYFPSFMKIGNPPFISDKYEYRILKNVFEKNSAKEINMTCEAKFDQIVNNIPKILYHITPLKHWEKISKIGLAPKSRSKNSYHPDRVYLTKDENSAENLVQKFYKLIFLKEWVLLKITTDDIPGEYFRLYYDPNYKQGFYTMNNIPPQAIEKIKDITI
jgi:hypothetical protein